MVTVRWQHSPGISIFREGHKYDTRPQLGFRMHSSHLVGPHAAHGRRKCRVAYIYQPVQLLAHVQRQHHRMSDGVDLPTGHDAEKHTWSWSDPRRQGHTAALHNHVQPRIAVAGVGLKYIAQYFIIQFKRLRINSRRFIAKTHTCCIWGERWKNERKSERRRVIARRTMDAVPACGADAVSSGWH